jgi:hypothetical protein
MVRKIVSNYRVALDTAVIVGAIVGFRGLLFALGADGMSLSPLTSSIVAGGVFVMGLVVLWSPERFRTTRRPTVPPPIWPPSSTRSCGNASRSTPSGASHTWGSCANG